MVVRLIMSVLCRWLVHSRHGILFFTRGDIVVDFSVIHAIPVNDSFTFGRFVLWCALNLPSDMMRSITTIASQLKVWSHNVKTSLFLLQRLTHNSPGSRWGFWPAIFELIDDLHLYSSSPCLLDPDPNHRLGDPDWKFSSIIDIRLLLVPSFWLSARSDRAYNWSAVSSIFDDGHTSLPRYIYIW